MPIAFLFAPLFGLAIGSFLNVVAWRMPRGESLAHPASHCPGCDHPVRPYDNLPVLSWLLLRGRCRDCHEPISARYPIVEAVTAALYVAVVAAKWDDVLTIALGLGLMTLLVPMTLIDLEHRIIPNRLLAPFAVLAIAHGLALDPSYVPEQLIAGAAGGGFFLAAAMAYPRGMGMGDVKLVAVLGLYLGRAVAPAIFFGLIAGVLVGAVIMARLGREAGRKTAVPFGPFLAIGAVLAFFVGNGLMDSYLERF
ncbi:MAG: leader peptidase (prepilin peptidase) / N-methyltransferase [Frankiaceae bacterium]|nr:leader peptidase (prepilin peptidase) / N-methyltransferase [Frankiaceae bacterium]